MSAAPVSVIIPVHNGATTLASAVASVLAQDPHLEVVIVDDGSTDGTAELIPTLPGRIVAAWQPQSGPAAARNRGLGLATSSLIAFLDDDDLWAADKLRVQLGLLTSGVGIVVGRSEFLAFDPVEEDWITPAPPQLLFSLGASLVRREVFDLSGPFDPGLRFSEDVDWFLRVRDAGVEIVVHDEIVQTVRRNGENMTRRKNLADLGLFHVLKRSLDRRRGASS